IREACQRHRCHWTFLDSRFVTWVESSRPTALLPCLRVGLVSLEDSTHSTERLISACCFAFAERFSERETASDCSFSRGTESHAIPSRSTVLPRFVSHLPRAALQIAYHRQISSRLVEQVHWPRIPAIRLRAVRLVSRR